MDTVSILDFEHTFTQRSAVPERDFVKLGKSRGLAIDSSSLESLHRQGIVVPFFSIRYVAADVVRRAREDAEALSPAEVDAILRYVSTERRDLLGERRVGDLADAARQPYRAWSVSSTYRSKPYARRRYLYSPYQLLGLYEILQMCPARDPRALERSQGRRQPLRGIKDHLRALGRNRRQLAMLLSLLEAAFLPEARPSLRGFALDMASWLEYRSQFRTEQAVEAAGYRPDDLVPMAEHLLSVAYAFDPMAKWSDLVGLVRYSMWDKLTGLARLAVDYRLAAEVMLLAHESLVARGVSKEDERPTGSRWWTPMDYRIRVPRERLDRTLTRFGLSPHPAVLVVTEGKVDRVALVGYLDERLRRGWRNAIRIVDSEGVNNDVSHLASLVGPYAASAEGDAIVLERPPTTIMIVADPEGPLSTDQGRASVRERWVERLWGALPEDLQTPASKADIRGLVEVHLWDGSGSSFEFAHFSDAQLAAAIQMTCTNSSMPAIAELERAIDQARATRKNLKTVWARWGAPRPSKMRIFRNLEPVFRATITRELDAGVDPPTYPAARVIVAILRRVAESPRHYQYVLRLA